jgi:hypothetical protein
MATLTIREHANYQAGEVVKLWNKWPHWMDRCTIVLILCAGAVSPFALIIAVLSLMIGAH